LQQPVRGVDVIPTVIFRHSTARNVAAGSYQTAVYYDASRDVPQTDHTYIAALKLTYSVVD